MNILVVEDDRTTAESLLACLRSAGHAATLARDGLNAFGLVWAGFKPDLVLCDLILPDADGTDVLDLLSRQPVLRGARLVAMTGLEGKGLERVQATLTRRGLPLLRKPFTADQLDAILRRPGSVEGGKS